MAPEACLTLLSLLSFSSLRPCWRRTGVHRTRLSPTRRRTFTLRPGVLILATKVTTDSGLSYRDKQIGPGRKAQEGDKVLVHYTLAGEDGNVVLDSREYGLEPAIFFVGDGTVIPAIDEAVRGMGIDGVRTLKVPPELGYKYHEDSTKGLVDEDNTIFMEIELKRIGEARLRQQIRMRISEVKEENRQFLEKYCDEYSEECTPDGLDRSGFFVEERRPRGKMNSNSSTSLGSALRDIEEVDNLERLLAERQEEIADAQASASMEGSEEGETDESHKT
ncbi:hypothetical protein AAMO2058_001300300 [Amorphochlora amoebiformis]